MKLFKALHIADKFLLVIMMILMLQSTYNLFFHEIYVEENNIIDVIIRSTSAAIFGYFISGNFSQKKSQVFDKKAVGNIEIISSISSDDILKPKAKIGFSTDKKILDSNKNYNRTNSKIILNQNNNIQIFVIAIIGIVSLLLLIISRDFIKTNQISIATLTQMRDFFSGSVGFLIGHSTHDSQN